MLALPDMNVETCVCVCVCMLKNNALALYALFCEWLVWFGCVCVCVCVSMQVYILHKIFFCSITTIANHLEHRSVETQLYMLFLFCSIFRYL